MDQKAQNSQQMKGHAISAERIRNNLQQLNSDTQEKRRKLKMTQQTIAKIMAEEERRQNRMKEKLFQVQEKREFEQQMKHLKLQEQIDNANKRIEQKKIDQCSKRVLPSIKDMFIQKKTKEEIENTLKKYELYPSKDDSNQEKNESADNSMRAQNMESLFFNLTAPSVESESMAERMLQKMKQQMPQKRGNKDKQKQQINPFYNKQNWEKFMEAERNGEQNIRFPGIGIERTPFYEIQQEEIERNKKKQEALQKLKKYYLNPKKKNIDFDSIYKRVKKITSPSLALLKVSPSDTLLGHMMEKSIFEARRIWGKQFLRSQSQNDFREKDSEHNQLSSIQEDLIISGRGQNPDQAREKIISFSKINSSSVNQSILRQQDETQMQSTLNQQAENSLTFQGRDQNESINTRRERVFKENILFSDSKI